MSTEAVKKQLLVSITALNLPLDCTPSSRRVGEACAAAKLLRNRLLREHNRVQEFIENLRQKQMFDEDTADDEAEEGAVFGGAAEANLNKSSRAEFIFVGEMMVVEKLVVPLLLAHGMKFNESLLPQLLKLLAAVLQPIPRFSANETLQHDLLKRIKHRCGTDEFFALLVQSVAPIAEKRSSGSLQREDVVLLEVVLSLITLLLDGHPQDVESIVGSFCRNHGIELLLVVINQNFAKMQQKSKQLDGGRRTLPENEEVEEAVDQFPSKTQEAQQHALSQIVLADDSDVENTLAPTLILNESGTFPATSDPVSLRAEPALPIGETEQSVSEHSDEDEEEYEEEEEELQVENHAADIERLLEEKVLNLLESEEQVWKWNCLAMASIANVFHCVFPAELAQLSFLGQMNVSSPDQLLNLLRGGNHFRECRKQADNWRFIARSRNGAMNSNSVLVRLDPNNRPGTVGGRAIGTVSSLFGTRRKDPLENIKDMDLRKRGRFVKGMFQDSTPRCDLPLPTKILLSQQSQSFLCFGFEPLNSMTWDRIQRISQDVERAAKEYKETVSGFKNSGEKMEITSPLGPELYQAFANVLRYMTICASLLHYIREVARLMKQDGVPFTSQQFQQQWQSVSSIISLGHLEGGFAVLRSFLQCRDLRRRCDVLDVVNYLAELLFMLNLILAKNVVDDPAVDIAAHALASSVLYKEENIKTVLDLLNEYANRSLSVSKSQALTLFVFAVFQLMERCSYKGSLLLPKRPKRKGTMNEAGDDGYADDDDKESVSSNLLAEMEKEMVEQMADMIDDDDSSSSGSGSESNSSSERGSHTAVTPNREDAERAGEMRPSGVLIEGNGTTPAAAATEAAGRESGDAAGSGNSQNEGAGGRPEGDVVGDASEDVVDVGERSRGESSARAPSEAHPPSVASLASSGRTALSTISSEREVAVGSYLRRLATTKNVSLLYSALRHWRINDVDVNLGLTYLMEGLTKEGCESVFFNVAFLLLFRDVIVHGRRTHGPLFTICDKLVYDFFNPGFAHALDFRTRSLFDENDVNVLTGSQSFLGFEVALRCGRSLFNFSAGDYAVLEEKAMPHLMDYTVIPLQQTQEVADRPETTPLVDSDAFTAQHPRDDTCAADRSEVTQAMVWEERVEPRRKKRRHHRSRGSADESNADKAEEGGAGKRRKKEERSGRRGRFHGASRRERQDAKARGPQPPPTAPIAVTDATADEEDKMFQALMAAIAPTAPLDLPAQPAAAAPLEEGEEDEAVLLR